MKVWVVRYWEEGIVEVNDSLNVDVRRKVKDGW